MFKSLKIYTKNRFVKANILVLTKEEFIKRAQIYSKNLGHELGVEFFSKLYDFALFIEKEGENNQWHENIKFSIRNCQRLCSYLLTERRTFEEFRAAMAIQYLNDLATDNDNSEKLETFKESPEIQEKIKDIYYSYDFAAIETKEEKNMKKPEYTVEFYRVVSVKKKITASTPEELKEKVEKLILEGVMDKNPTKTSETEWEVLFDE